MFLKYLISCLCLFCTLYLTAQTIDVQHYKFNLKLSDASDSIAGNAQIQLKIVQPAKQFTLQLKSVVAGKGMQVSHVSGSHVQSFQHSNNQLVIQLAAMPHPDSVYTYHIQYSGMPADGLIIAKNKWGDRTFFSDNWPNRAHHWLPCNDTPADKATVEFGVTAPLHYQVVSNGVQVEESNWGSNEKFTHWQERIPIPTKVMVIGAARFAVKNYVDSNAVADVSAWVYPQDSSKGFYDYALAPSILRFFHHYVGDYAFEKLANVQSKTIFGGMENASAIFYNESSVTGTRSSEGLIAHEIAHQWFGNMATEKSFAHLWLSEGFASYLTHLYLESKYGRDTLQKGLWQDRSQVVHFAKSWNKPVVDSTSDLMDLLNANSYQKGSWVLHMLRNEVGDDIFRKIIQTYYTKYKGGNADTRDFQAIAESVSKKDLSLFFKQWLYKPSYPQLKVSWQQLPNRDIRITVKQLQPALFVFPLRIGLLTGAPTYPMEQLKITQKEQSFTLKGYVNVLQLELDPLTELLFEGVIIQQK